MNENLLADLSMGVLPSDVVADIGRKMQSPRSEIERLHHTEPPKNYSVETIRAWRESLKTAPDCDTVHLLIERTDIKNKTVFNIQSTLKTVLGDIVWV